MNPREISVLVVDDSPVVREVLAQSLGQRFGKVYTATDGKIALNKIERFDPQVVTLDINMPGMDGIETLREIMRRMPRPVIMLSALASRGAEKTMLALELGAVDFIQKPVGVSARVVEQIFGSLAEKIAAVASTKHRWITQDSKKSLGVAPRVEATVHRAPPPSGVQAVLIGASTGGTEAIRQVLTVLPEAYPVGLVIVQHMLEGYTRPFAERLDSLCRIRVKEAEDGERILPGVALVAPANHHAEVQADGENRFVVLHQEAKVSGHRPSADVLFTSGARVFGARAIGVIMTGMGADGAQGLRLLHDAGALTVAQDEESCIVFGMPKAAIDADAVSMVGNLEVISETLLRLNQ